MEKNELAHCLIDYEESFGEVKFPEGFLEKLQGKSIEEQMEYFRISDSSYYSIFEGRDRAYSGCMSLEKSHYIQALVVRDGIIVGAKIADDICLPGEGTCTYYAREENGAGYKELSCSEYFVCYPH